VPLILTQHASRDLNRYLDREGVIYHFPRVYLPLVNQVLVTAGDQRFVYQRPTKGAPPGQAGTYFGHGFLGRPYEDTQTPGHYFMDVMGYERMRNVPLRDPQGFYYESGSSTPLMLRGKSIRYVEPERYFLILAAGQAYSAISAPADLQDVGTFAPALVPVDAFRPMTAVPPGTGYVPHGNEMIDRQEVAALHERARADHQATLEQLVTRIQALGGTCEYNNNVDLFARLGERRFLVEAKSLTRQASAVNRMRYGMGQLFDYAVRYKAELRGAEPVLAFGSPPERDVSWIPTILQANGVAFVARGSSGIEAGNDLGRALPFID
jgi:hypothetical protein